MVEMSVSDAAARFLAQPVPTFAGEANEWGWYDAIDPEKSDSKEWSDA